MIVEQQEKKNLQLMVIKGKQRAKKRGKNVSLNGNKVTMIMMMIMVMSSFEMEMMISWESFETKEHSKLMFDRNKLQ